MNRHFTSILCIFLGLLGCAHQEGGSRTISDGSASGVVRKIYENAISGNCSQIPRDITTDLLQSIAASDPSMNTLCDSLTESKSVIGVDVIGETISEDHGKVQIALKHKNGRVEEREEVVRKLDGRWRMDS